mmetsp:Transcript_7226/g.5492  ORF Transcript_7226/g.5492 Transcript_7226/m.5492 type:complete len:98 (+) Transcript_7226:124-417(+)
MVQFKSGDDSGSGYAIVNIIMAVIVAVALLTALLFQVIFVLKNQSKFHSDYKIHQRWSSLYLHLKRTPRSFSSLILLPLFRLFFPLMLFALSAHSSA